MNSLALSKATGEGSHVHTRAVSIVKGKLPVDFNVEIKYKYSPNKI